MTIWVDFEVGFRRLTLAAIATLAILASLPAGRAAAQDVVLNPELIQGTVSIGAEPLSTVFIRATSGSFGAREIFYSSPDDPTVINYSLTVDAPLTGDRTYTVEACSVTMQDTFDGFCFSSVDVVVTDNDTPSVQDFTIYDPAFIQGTVSVTGGVETLSFATLFGHYGDPRGNRCFDYVSPCFHTRTDASRAGAYRIAVPAGTGIEIFPDIRLASGVRLIPPAISTVTVDLLPGEVKTVDIAIDPPSGKIVGTVTNLGPEIATSHFVRVTGAADKSVSIPGDGAYELAGLPDGTNYTFTVDSYFSGGRLYRFPAAAFSPSGYPDIAGGSTETVDASVAQSAIAGVLVPTGSASLADLNFGMVGAVGASANSSGGMVQDRIDIATGAYDFVASEGVWRYNVYIFNLQRNGAADPSDNFSETLYITPRHPFAPEVTLTAGATAGQDIVVPMGKVTVNFSVFGGGLLSLPTLQIGCGQVNADGQAIYTFSGSSTGSGQIDVTSGAASFLAPAGACTVTARATVDGTVTSFGQIEVEVVPGIDQAIDLEGPVLFNIFPEPGLIVGTDTIIVTGDATDGIAVASVTVNGVETALMPAGDPDDSIKVSFESPPLPLVPGPNGLTIVATDTAGKTAGQTRAVCFDLGAPIAVWNPANDLAATITPIQVAGTATDDAGIGSITVNGTAIFTAGDTSTAPAAQQFSTYVDLVPGRANGIEVVVTDICGRQTAETRFVSLVDNTPPVAQDVVVITNEDTPVATTLDATDPENDPLTYAIMIQPLHGTLSGGAPNLTYTPNANYFGVDSFTYRATDDRQLSSNTATVPITIISVNDTPMANAGTDIVQACTLAGGAPVTLDASGSSDVDGDLLAHTWAGPFTEGSGAAAGETVTVTLPFGSSEVLLTAGDGTVQATDTVNVMVTVQAAGLQSPLTSLVPAGDEPPMPKHAFKQGRTLPLKLGLLCGSTVLTDTDASPPRIVAIVSEGGTPEDLTMIDPDAGEANDGGVLFRYSADGVWVHNLNTTNLSADTVYIVTIEMPDGRRNDAKFAFK